MSTSHLAVRLVGNKHYVNRSRFNLDVATEEEKVEKVCEELENLNPDEAGANQGEGISLEHSQGGHRNRGRPKKELTAEEMLMKKVMKGIKSREYARKTYYGQHEHFLKKFRDRYHNATPEKRYEMKENIRRRYYMKKHGSLENYVPLPFDPTKQSKRYVY